jgi:hypothetical protein
MKKLFTAALILSLLVLGQSVAFANTTGMQDDNYKQSFTLGNSMFHVSQDERTVHYKLYDGNQNALVCKGGHTVAYLSGQSGMLTELSLMHDAKMCHPNIHTVPHLVQAFREGQIYLGTHGTGTTTATTTGHTYKVTIENLSGTQPLSPGVIATHNDSAYLWRNGMMASEGIRLIAEEGKPQVALAEAKSKAGVSGVTEIDMPIHRIGGSGSSIRTFEVTAAQDATKISLATMLVCTNDGLTGLDSAQLPHDYSVATYYVNGYDAGTELNDERSQTIVDGCGKVGTLPLPMDGDSRVATSEVVHHHPGIMGTADLSKSAHGWNNPVAKITIQKVN